MNIVVIGGGSGSSVVLEGLKKYRDLNLSVIVGMMDDGGSNAVVRDEFGLLPLSDVRKSILALAEDNENKFLRELLTYRFANENMKGHTLGNLLMIARIFELSLLPCGRSREILPKRHKVFIFIEIHFNIN